MWKNEDGSRTNLVMTLSSPKILLHSLHDFTWVGRGTLNNAHRLEGSFVQSLQLGARKSCQNHMEEGILFRRCYPLNSIKTHGIWNILSRAEQWIRICSGFRWRGGSWDESREWQTASVTRHISLRWWNKAYLQNLRISFLVLNSCLSWMHLHSPPCSWVAFSVDPPLSSWEPQPGSNLCTEDALPRHGTWAQSLKQNKTMHLQRR